MRLISLSKAGIFVSRNSLNYEKNGWHVHQLQAIG